MPGDSMTWRSTPDCLAAALKLAEGMRDAGCPPPTRTVRQVVTGWIAMRFDGDGAGEYWIIDHGGVVQHQLRTHGMSVAEAMARLRCRKAGVGSP